MFAGDAVHPPEGIIHSLWRLALLVSQNGGGSSLKCDPGHKFCSHLRLLREPFVLRISGDVRRRIDLASLTLTTVVGGGPRLLCPFLLFYYQSALPTPNNLPEKTRRKGKGEWS